MQEIHHNLLADESPKLQTTGIPSWAVITVSIVGSLGILVSAIICYLHRKRRQGTGDDENANLGLLENNNNHCYTDIKGT